MIRYYITVDVRTDFLPYQLRCFEAFSQEPFEFVVLDNTQENSVALQAEIKAVCNSLKLRYVRVPPDYLQEKRTAQSSAHAAALEWVWKEIILPEAPEYAVFLDFDLFPTAKFSLVELLDGATAVGRFQSKGPGISYLWPGFLGMHFSKLVEPETISWWGGRINGYPVDIGGQFARYWKDHPELIANYLAFARIQKTEHITLLPVLARETYRSEFTLEVLGSKFLHYCAGTGWNNPSEELVREKTQYVFDFLERCLSGEWEMP